METRFQYILLAIGVCCAAITGLTHAQEDNQSNALDQIVTPDLDRDPIKPSDLDTENFEIGAFYGIYNIEDFGSNSVAGARLAYHVSSAIFVDAAYAQTTVGETSFERLSGGTQILTEEQRDLDYWTVSIGYKILPGELFLGSRRAMNANFYLLAGAGNTNFADNEYFTYSIGAGLQLYPTDWLAIHIATKALSFEHELLGSEQSITNLESSLGLSFYF